MKIIITFRNMEHTSALDEKIRQKTRKLEKYLGGNSDIHWTCSIQEGGHHADINLLGPTFHYNASAASDNMYKTLDLVIAKIEKQLYKRKDKWKNKMHRKNDISFGPESNDSELEEEMYEDIG